MRDYLGSPTPYYCCVSGRYINTTRNRRLFRITLGTVRVTRWTASSARIPRVGPTLTFLDTHNIYYCLDVYRYYMHAIRAVHISRAAATCPASLPARETGISSRRRLRLLRADRLIYRRQTRFRREICGRPHDVYILSNRFECRNFFLHEKRKRLRVDS